MDVLVIYQFCTFGGVERAVLNRAKAFRKAGLDVKLSVGYLFDYGALLSFQATIRRNDLAERLSAFLIDEDSLNKLDQYDLVLVIDTPQVFQRILHAGNLFLECHTAYIENRQYLKSIPQYVRGLLVPSESFKQTLTAEFSRLPPISVLPNPLAEEFLDLKPLVTEEFFARPPLTYFARLDELKNINEALRIFESLADLDEMIFFIIGNIPDAKALLHTLERKKLLGQTLVRNGIVFDQAPYLVDLVRRHKGLFLSPSKGESFGLSAAEFISGGVPVLLSDIPAHRELVEDDERFLYPLGNIAAAKKKALAHLRDWEQVSARSLEFARKFRETTFITAWQDFISRQKL